MLPANAPLSVKQSRFLPNPQLSPSAGQSLLLMQPRYVWIEQNCSNGPDAHSPSSLEAVSEGFGEQVASSHWFGAVAWPGQLQNPPGQSGLAVQGVPTFALPGMQRLPPHTVAPTATQSAFELQIVLAALLHVSQKHLRLVKPIALQFGLAADSVTAWLLVESVSPDGMTVPMKSPVDGGQSKLTGPKSGLVSVVVHAWPTRAPALHNPALHCGHGVSVVMPL
jgi:hypothetical protein